MEQKVREPSAIQTKMAPFEPLKIDHGDYEIHVISDPHTLTYRQQNGIIREIRDVTRTYRPKASRKEVSFRTVNPDVSLLLVVREKQSGKAVGYISTRTPLEDTIHLHASVFDPRHQDLSFYPFCKLLAQALERKKMQLHGKTAHFVTAQSQEPDVLAKLAANDGMWPAPLHGRNAKVLNTQAARVSHALDSDVPYEPGSGIRVGGLRAIGDKKNRPKPLMPHVIQTALRRLSADDRKKLGGILAVLDRPRGDAALAIRRIDREHDEKLKTAELLIHPHLQPLLLAELALGVHRRDVGDVRIHSGIIQHPTGQKIKLLEINVDARNVDWKKLNADLRRERQAGTPLGLALRGMAADKTWERTAQNHAVIAPASPKMLIPLGPMVEPFLKILRSNLLHAREKRTK